MSKILNDNGWKHLFGIIKGAFVSNTDVEEATLVDVYSKTETDTALSGKVDKVAGKGLSSNDFTATYKNEIDTLWSDYQDALNLI